MKRLILIVAMALVPGLLLGQYITGRLPDDGALVLRYDANSAGNGTTTLCFTELISTALLGSAPNYDGYFLAVIHDAGGTGAAPQIEYREVSDYSSTTGVLTFGTAFSALGAGDKCYLFQSSVMQAIAGTQGYSVAPVAAKIGLNVNLAEGLLRVTDVTDSALAYIHSATGMPAATGAFPIAGLSLNEKVQFLADTLRKVGVSTDSTLHYIHSGTGAPSVTGAFPTAGLSLLERVQFLADSLRKVAVSTDSILAYIHSATGAPAVTGAFPAAGLSELERIQWMADSLRLAFVQLARVLDSLEDANDLLQKLNGVTAGFVDENVWTTVEVIVNFAAAGAWEEAAGTHELFTVTGDVEFAISAFCSTDVTVTSADSLILQTEGGADAIIGWLGADIDAGEAIFPPWYFAGAQTRGLVANYFITSVEQTYEAGSVWRGTIFMGQDIGFDIDDNDFTGGIVVFYCRWRPVTTGGSVVAGLGGSL